MNFLVGLILQIFESNSYKRIRQRLTDMMSVTLLQALLITLGKGEKMTNRRYVIKLRTHLGLTQVKFAHRLGVSVLTVQKWEQGHNKPIEPPPALISLSVK